MTNAADFRRIARDALRGRWALAVGTGFIAVLLGATSFGGSSSNGNGGDSAYHFNYSTSFYAVMMGVLSIILIWALITFFIGGAIELGYCKFNVNLIKGSEPKFTDLFSRLDIFWKALGLRLAISIFTFLWALLLIIPGIIAIFSYSMAFYIMDEHPEMGILEAIRASKEMMRGNRLRLFFLELSFIGWLILSAFTFGIGLLWLIPYMHASIAAFYLEVSEENTAFDN